MFCPYCDYSDTEVVNSRATKKNTRVWRRRKCIKCKSVFTTHEAVDLSNIVIIKKSGKTEYFNRAKLYSGIYGSTIGLKVEDREKLVEKITKEVETKILRLKVDKIESSKVGDIVLSLLKKMHTASFLRFLSYNKNIASEEQMIREFKKYTSR